MPAFIGGVPQSVKEYLCAAAGIHYESDYPDGVLFTEHPEKWKPCAGFRQMKQTQLFVYP